MSFSERAKATALAIVKIFETGKPFGDYSAVAVLKDGAGISYGTSQFTHKSGSLSKVLQRYLDLGGTIRAAVLRNYLPQLKAKTNITGLSRNAELKKALADAGKTPLMQQAQREIAFENYLKPSIDAAEGSDFVLPLSLAVIYDSKNHGSYDKIRDKVKLNFPASIKPIEFEKEWITEYVKKRDSWLEGHSNPLLRQTDYRTDFFLAQIGRGNWNLDLPLNVNGHKLTEAILFPKGSPAADPAIPSTSESNSADDLVSESNPSNGLPPAETSETVITTEKETVLAEDGTRQTTTETTTETRKPMAIPAFIPRFGKQWFLGLIPGGGFLATLGSYFAGLPPWVVFLFGVLTGVALYGFFQMLIKHRQVVIDFIKMCYQTMADPEKDNLIPTPAAGFVGQRKDTLTALFTPEPEVEAETGNLTRPERTW